MNDNRRENKINILLLFKYFFIFLTRGTDNNLLFNLILLAYIFWQKVNNFFYFRRILEA